MRIEIEPGVRLFVDVCGQGLVPDGGEMRERPTLLLLHGGPGADHSTYKPVFDPLADVAQLVYYDHRGNGRSDARPRDEWNLDTWAGDVGRLIEALGLVRPIILGVSFGGVVAQKFASMSPDSLGGMILISTFPFADLEEQIEMFRQLGGDEAAQAARDALTPGDSRPDDARERFLEICGDLYTQSDGNVFGSPTVLFNHGMAEHFIRGEGAEMDLRSELGQVTTPTLILAGALIRSRRLRERVRFGICSVRSMSSTSSSRTVGMERTEIVPPRRSPRSARSWRRCTPTTTNEIRRCCACPDARCLCR